MKVNTWSLTQFITEIIAEVNLRDRKGEINSNEYTFVHVQRSLIKIGCNRLINLNAFNRTNSLNVVQWKSLVFSPFFGGHSNIKDSSFTLLFHPSLRTSAFTCYFRQFAVGMFLFKLVCFSPWYNWNLCLLFVCSLGVMREIRMGLRCGPAVLS